MIPEELSIKTIEKAYQQIKPYINTTPLIKANKDFDLIIFPNKRHGFGDQNNYFTRRKWDYFVEHLLGLTPPDEFNLD